MIQNRKHYTCATRSSLLADFTLKRVVASRLHDTVARFHTFLAPVQEPR